MPSLNNQKILNKRRKKANKRRAITKKKHADRKKRKQIREEKVRKQLTIDFHVTNENIPQAALNDIYRSVQLDDLDHDDRCQICLYGFGGEEEDAIILRECKGHYFHRGCVEGWMNDKRYCPCCKTCYGVRIGNMPTGAFSSHVVDQSCNGYHCGTIVISWHIPAGIQADNHPNPGQHYSGAYRTGYLPNNRKGRLVFRLLKLAFERRHMFTVGFSITRHCDNVTIWNGIHAKTSMHGGAWGYPDATYLDRVLDELAQKGITPNDLSRRTTASAPSTDEDGLFEDSKARAG